ncbi:MAG: hypothetical protein ACO38P_02415 [Phycisphaerales bacterium]
MPRAFDRLRSSSRPVVIALACAAAAIAGCVNVPPPTPASRQQLNDAVELSAQLLAIADIASSVFSDRVVQLRINGAPDLIVYTAEAIRNNSVANYRAIALSPDPANGLVNMYIYANLGSWACETRVATHPDFFEEDCDATYGEVLREVRELAHEWMSPEQIADLDRRIGDFRSRHPDRMVIGMVRLEDLAHQFAQSEQRKDQVTPSLFSPVTEAAQQLEQVRLLGDRAIWLLSRLPEALSWRASAFLMEVLSSEGFTAIKTLASELSERLHLVQTNVDVLARSMHDLGADLEQGSATISALGAGVVALDGRMETLDASLAKTAAGLESMGESLQPLPGRLGSLESTMSGLTQSLDQGRAGLQDLSASGAALESKLALLEAKVDALGSSIASLTDEIETLEGAKSIVDATLVKAAGLGALLIVFAGVSRYAVHHLTKAK